MRRISRLGSLLATISVLLLLNACGGGMAVPGIELENNDPVQQVASLKNDLGAARERQLDVLAPKSFAKADQLFQEAQRMLSREETIADILLKTISARVELQRAEQTAQIAHTVLGNVIKVRNLALSAGAAQLGDDFTEAEQAFLKLTRAIENSDLKWAQRHKSENFEAFDQLELRAIKDLHLTETRRLLEAAEERRAEKIAPLTLTEARETLREADEFISANRYQRGEIIQQARNALFQVRRLEIIMRETDGLKTLSSEQIARRLEHQLYAAASRLGAPDQRDQVFPEQLESVLATIDAWEQASQQLNDEVVTQQGVNDKLRTEIATLENLTREEREARELLVKEKQEKQRFQQLFPQVRNLFKPGEAEIYKQADRLIIRLQAIQFPVGSATVSSENYPLLAKVRQAILLFGQPETVVEGHTDSTGTEANNRELSQGRAESVMAYLVANETLPGDKIKAVGFGSQRPVASEATAEGRALNRRIDLIITPEWPGATP